MGYKSIAFPDIETINCKCTTMPDEFAALKYVRENNFGLASGMGAFFAKEYAGEFVMPGRLDVTGNMTFTIGPPKISESTLASAKKLMSERFAAQIVDIVQATPVEPPLAIPTGWPPAEEFASVIDEDGVRVVRGDAPQGGTPLNDVMTLYLSFHGMEPGKWKCSCCGTHNPADPCIPGAYF